MQTFGVGIIGFGFMGRMHAYSHINMPLYYGKIPCKTRLVGVATSKPETAEAACQAAGFEFATTDWRELIARRDIHIIHVCTPNKYHAEQVMAALQAGKHIYCDKPLCTTVNEAEEIAALLPTTKVIHQMALNNRFFPATLRARELMEEGFVGEILGLRAAYLHAGSVNRGAALKWKLDPSISGGGVLFDLGSHVLDLVQWLVGNLQIVNCTTHVAYKERPTLDASGKTAAVTGEDAVYITVKTPNGAVGHIEASKIATGTLDELRFEIHGEKGALRFNLMQPNYLEAYDQTAPASKRGWCALETAQAYPSPAIFPSSKVGIGWVRAHTAGLYNFLAALAEGKPAEPGLEVGVQLQHLMAEAYDKATRR